MLLREAAERERTLLEEKKELQDQVEVLERFPQGAPSGANDVVRDLQLSRFVQLMPIFSCMFSFISSVSFSPIFYLKYLFCFMKLLFTQTVIVSTGGIWWLLWFCVMPARVESFSVLTLTEENYTT